MRHLFPSLGHRSARTLGPLAVALALLSGCGLEGPGSRDECAVDSDCPTGQECELEHGAPWCQAHGGGGDGGTTGGAACATDADCPAGEECELEHGSSFCKPHGGSD